MLCTRYGMKGIKIWGLHKTYCGIFRGELKVGKGRDLGDLRRNKYGKLEGKWDKNGQLLMNRGRSLHSSVSYPLMKQYVQLFSQACGSLFCVHLCVWRCECLQLPSDHGSQGSCFCGDRNWSEQGCQQQVWDDGPKGRCA